MPDTGRPPAYLARAKELEAMIVRRGLVPGARLPSERRLRAELKATAWQVNQAVRHLLQQGRLVKEGYRIFLRAVQGAPLSEPPARSRDPTLLAILSPGRRLGAGFQEAARLGGANVRELAWSEESPLEQLRLLRREGVHGLLALIPERWTAATGGLLAELRRRGIAVVLFGRGAAGISRVYDNTRGAMRTMLEQLRARGARRVTYFGPAPIGESVEADSLEFIRLAAAGMKLELTRQLTRSSEPDVITAAARQLLNQRPAADGVVCYSEQFAMILSELSVHSPVSRLHLDDAIIGREAVDSGTFSLNTWPCLAVDHFTHGLIAGTLLLTERRHWETHGTFPPPSAVAVDLRFAVRGQVRPPKPIRRGASGMPPAGTGWPPDDAERRQAVRTINQRPHPALAALNPTAGAFVPLDLRLLANRGLRRMRSWLGGLPLLHLDPGRHTVHGVPFEVLDDHGKECAAIVLRSSHARTALGRPLPTRVEIPVRRRAEAIFWLQGCGWATDDTEFADYEVVYERGRSITLPLKARGDRNAPADGASLPNVEDWWPGSRLLDNAASAPFVVAPRDDPYIYERRLYTFGWLNPHPTRTVRCLRLSTRNEGPQTLGILAVTLFRAGAG